MPLPCDIIGLRFQQSLVLGLSVCKLRLELLNFLALLPVLSLKRGPLGRELLLELRSQLLDLVLT
jgi:hypothetical protein